MQKNDKKNLVEVLSSFGKSLIIMTMEKLKNLINNFTHPKMVIVSDYAAALGAEHKHPSRKDVKNQRYLWVAEKKLAPKYQMKRGKQEPIDYEEVVGIAPDLTASYVNYGFAVQGGLMTYHNKYVMFPQRRVGKALEAYLTELLKKDPATVNEYEFSKIEQHFIHSYGDNIENKVEEASYYYQGNPYRLRVDQNNENDPYQWYRIAPVAAHYVNQEGICDLGAEESLQIQCDDVLFADHSYDERKFVDDLRDSTNLKTIPYVRTQAATQKNDENTKGL